MMSKSEATIVQELVYEITVGEVMTENVITVVPETSMAELSTILREHSISGTPVMDDGKMVGIISLENLIQALAAGEMQVPVAERMTRDPVALRPDDPIVTAFSFFTEHGFGRFPVLDDTGRLVGILTPGDISRGLLRKLEREYHDEEVRQYRASHVFDDVISDRTSIILRYSVGAGDFDHGGEASSKLKLALSRLGADPRIIRRAAIAAYEAEMNIIIHASKGGELVADISPSRLVIRAVDTGPGIADTELALQPGYSTAPEWVREMGFGAGMGLPNIKRCADEMLLKSSPGLWTIVEATIYLNDKHRKTKEAAT